MIFDDTACTLGEGALWHADRGALIWFDILDKRMHMKAPGGALQVWDFPDRVSAAGIVDRDRLIVASSRALILFDLRDGSRRDLVRPEADNPVTRSNDGRADPQGGFWSAQWGASRVACYDADGRFVRDVPFPASQISCPAFGGADLRTLYATSARVDLEKPRREDGMTLSADLDVAGQPEHRVIID